MKRLFLLGWIAAAACAPNFAAPCADDSECGDGYGCDEGRCVPGEGEGEGEGEDGGLPPPDIVGRGEICDDVTLACEEGVACVFLGSRPGYSVCEPLPSTGACPADQISVLFCTANTDEAPPHTVDCNQRHCVAPHPDRAGAEGDPCTTDDDCAMRTCAYEPSGQTVCRSNRPLLQGARAADEDGTFTPACAPPLEGAEEDTRGVVSCRYPCQLDSDCPTGVEDELYRICTRELGLCDQPACNFEGCEGFEGSDCRFGVICRSDNYDMPGNSCGGSDGCVDGRECWRNDVANMCQPYGTLPGGGCAETYQEITVCDGPCRQACVHEDICENDPELCVADRGTVGEIVDDVTDCAFPLEAIDMGALKVCAEGCLPSTGFTNFTCGEPPSDERSDVCNYAGEAFCPLRTCDACVGTEVCANTPVETLFGGTDPALLEICLDDGSCRVDADCPQRCASTVRQCAIIDGACTGTVISAGFQPANWLRDVDIGTNAQAASLAGASYRYGGSYNGDVATNYLYILHPDGSGWSWIFIGGILTRPGGTEGASVAADPARGRLLVYGGRDDDGVHVSELWAFNVATYVWTQITPLTGTPPLRTDHTAAVVGDELVLIGGTDDVGATAEVARFDLVNRVWTAATPAGSPTITDHAMVVRDDGSFLVAGATPSLYTFVPSTSTWTEVTTAGLLNRTGAALVRDTREATEVYLMCAGLVAGVADAGCARIDAALAVTAGPTLPTAIASPTAAVHPGTGRAFVQGDEGGFVLVPEDLCIP